ncbi:hypothetical protein [Ramlibacter sp.]|uniref:hypothetical protein n=1 Tax=Ramlibacter sp. TaxID=1917967 RepID=UPI003D14D13A
MRRLLAIVATVLALAGCASQVVPPIEGLVWQPDNDNVALRGDWQKLGVKRLLVQWTAVDDISFVDNGGVPSAPKLPDWQRIAAEPWAQEVIVGLAGRFDEGKARAGIVELAEQSVRIAQSKPPVNVSGWYFPVEIDPTWTEAPKLGPLLNKLPRPLWISVYDSANVGPYELAESLASWLPPDVGVFFQDGVGVHAREAYVARHYTNVLAAKLGKQRVRVIAEAFRPKQGGGFRPATLDELRPQLATYQGYPIYLFEGRYVPGELVNQLAASQAGRK